MKVWLNGSLLQKDGNITRRPFFKYYRFLPLHLRKGNNLLVMKVDQEKASLPDQALGIGCGALCLLTGCATCGLSVKMVRSFSIG